MSGDDLRYRFKSQKRDTHSSDKSGGIFGIWDEQRRMQVEEDKMALELSEAKKRAKELKKTLRKHQYGEAKSSLYVNIKKIFKNVPLVFKGSVKKTKIFLVSNKKQATTGLVILLFGSISLTAYSKLSINNPTSTLGESTASVSSDTLPREKPEFSLLFPFGKGLEDYDVVRISPLEAEPSYTYIDNFTEGGQTFRVTQQKIPENFTLSETALDFQASNVIQVDENIIYHGYSEQGGIQSLIFIKNEKLVTIRSSQKFDDDLWANYYLSLN